jgi:hypothetical protein
MWNYIIGYVVTLVLGYLFAPKPQNAKPAGLSDVQAATAEVGREIPVLFGTRDLEGPNVVWYGHLKTKAIKVKGGKK